MVIIILGIFGPIAYIPTYTNTCGGLHRFPQLFSPFLMPSTLVHNLVEE